jgi:hypothetical protein
VQDADSWDRSQIYSQNAISFIAQRQSLGGQHYLAFLYGIFGCWKAYRGIGFCFKALHQPLHFFLAGGDSSLIFPVQIDGLLQREQMLLAVVSH